MPLLHSVAFSHHDSYADICVSSIKVACHIMVAVVPDLLKIRMMNMLYVSMCSLTALEERGYWRKLGREHRKRIAQEEEEKKHKKRKKEKKKNIR
ncbi:hypothetical protein ADUPG1_005526, partial [Aduncisulcus paluster]